MSSGAKIFEKFAKITLTTAGVTKNGKLSIFPPIRETVVFYGV